MLLLDVSPVYNVTLWMIRVQIKDGTRANIFLFVCKQNQIKQQAKCFAHFAGKVPNLYRKTTIFTLLFTTPSNKVNNSTL